MSTPPRPHSLGGGTREFGQNMIVQKIMSAHNLQEMERRRRDASRTVPNYNNRQTSTTTATSSASAGSNLAGKRTDARATRPSFMAASMQASESDPLLQIVSEEHPSSPSDHLPPSEARKVIKFMQRTGSFSLDNSSDNPSNNGNDATISMESTNSGQQQQQEQQQHTFFPSSSSFGSVNSWSSLQPPSQAIRFQVLLWNVGALDVVQGRVPVTFRVTIFWNDLTGLRDPDPPVDDNDSCASVGPSRLWVMRGRQKAVPVARESKDEAIGQEAIDVPPVSILNVVTFDTIGPPEVALLRQDTGLWQWTCMYRATLIQEHWDVHNFPHDEHEICLKLAVLAHRKAESRWDRRYWQLGLATEKDSMGCVRIPHGLVVGELNIPEFQHDKDLKFSFEPLDMGSFTVGDKHSPERCLKVKLRVRRNSYYYDRNIVPLLGTLNLVAITITGLTAEEFFQRGLLTLNIAFVEISIRMATDKHLPSVPYQIKLQRVLNHYFFGLLFLVLESNLVYELHRYGYGSITGAIDLLAACTVLTHNVWTLYDYYVVSRQPKSHQETLPLNR